MRGYSEDGDNFDNFGGALLSLFVLVTEENFPMVADPSFTQRPLVRAMKTFFMFFSVSFTLRFWRCEWFDVTCREEKYFLLLRGVPR